jgi:hypothetical protein
VLLVGLGGLLVLVLVLVPGIGHELMNVLRCTRCVCRYAGTGVLISWLIVTFGVRSMDSNYHNCVVYEVSSCDCSRSCRGVVCKIVKM